MCFLLACQYRFKAFSIYFCLRLSSYYIDKSRDNIYVFYQRVTYASRLNHSRPTNDTGRVYPRIITSPFGKRQAVALFAQIYDNRFIRHFFLIQDRKDITKFLIHIIDLCQIMGKQLASLGNIYIHRRQCQFVRIKLRGIAFIPGSMWLIGSYKQTERFAFRLAIGNKFLNCFKIQVPTYQRRYIKVERKY